MAGERIAERVAARQRESRREDKRQQAPAFRTEYDTKGKDKAFKDEVRQIRKDFRGPVDENAVNLIRDPANADERKFWTDTYDDDGIIQWSTSSKRGTKERREEKRIFNKLEKNTGLDFERVRKGPRDSDIHIKQFNRDGTYMKRKYKGEPWYDGGGYYGLHHYQSEKKKDGSGWQNRSRVEAIKGSPLTLAHEIGHALGLRDLSNNKEQKATEGKSVMSYNTSEYASNRRVPFTHSDYEAIKRNYGL